MREVSRIVKRINGLIIQALIDTPNEPNVRKMRCAARARRGRSKAAH